jgi:hypothetical protein
MISREMVPGFVTVCVTVTLCVVVVGMVGTLLVGLFVKGIDNIKIFEAITPAFQMIIGSFVGVLGGIEIGKLAIKKEKAE